MTEIDQQILQSLSSGPKSLSELWQHLGGTWTAEQIDRALWGLQDGKKCEYMPAVGTWKLGVDA